MTDDLGAPLTKRFDIPAVGAIDISNPSLPTGRVGRSYSARLVGKFGKKQHVVAGRWVAPIQVLSLDATTGRSEARTALSASEDCSSWEIGPKLT